MKLKAHVVEDKGEEGKEITGQYIEVVEAEVHLGDPDNIYERTRFLKLATSGGDDQDDPPEFEEETNLVWNGYECTPRGDIHKHIVDAETRDQR
jgi:hypothetical protein